MKERKYKDYFQIKTVTDPVSGKEKRKANYTGQYYHFSKTGKGKAACLKFLLPGGAVLLLLWLSYLFADTPGCRCLYVLPIHACALFPLVYLILGFYHFIRSPENMTIVQKENGIGRILHSTIGFLCIESLAFIGDWVQIFVQRNFSEEWPGLAILFASVLISIVKIRFLLPIYQSLEVQSEQRGDPLTK